MKKVSEVEGSKIRYEPEIINDPKIDGGPLTTRVRWMKPKPAIKCEDLVNNHILSRTKSIGDTVRIINTSALIPNLAKRIEFYCTEKEKEELRFVQNEKNRKSFLHYIYAHGMKSSFLEWKLKLDPDFKKRRRDALILLWKKRRQKRQEQRIEFELS